MKIGRLGDHATFLSGFAFKSTKFNKEGNGTPLIRIRDVVRGYSETYFAGDYDERYLVKKGEYLIGMDGEFNLARWNSEPSLLNQRVCKIDAISSNIDRDYLSKFLPAALKEIEDATPFVTVKHLSVKALNEIQIPLPPLAEQKRIAGILDAADALRAKRRAALAQLDSLTQSLFLDLFGDPVSNPMGWEFVSVGEEVDFLTSGSRGWAQYYATSGDFFVRIQNLRGGNLDLSDAAYVCAPESAEARRTKVEPGDVLLSITADLGRTAVVPYGIGKAHINQHLAILRLRTLNPTFVSHQIATNGCQTQFVTLNRAAVKAGLNFNDVRSIRLMNPPLPLQRRFATLVESIERQKTRHRAHLAELDALFASLQHRAFRGEL